MENCVVPAQIYLPSACSACVQASVTPSRRRLRRPALAGGWAARDRRAAAENEASGGGESADVGPAAGPSSTSSPAPAGLGADPGRWLVALPPFAEGGWGG